MTILYALMVALVTMLVTTITSLYNLTKELFTQQMLHGEWESSEWCLTLSLHARFLFYV